MSIFEIIVLLKAIKRDQNKSMNGCHENKEDALNNQ